MREKDLNKFLIMLSIVCVVVLVCMNCWMLYVVGAFDTWGSSDESSAAVLEYAGLDDELTTKLVASMSDIFVYSPVGKEINYTFGDEPVTIKVFIDESRVGCKPGRKNVYAQFRYSSRGGADYISCSAFDKYTGTSFSHSPYSSDDAVTFDCNGTELGIFSSRTGEIRFAGQYEQEVVVNCYEDYDGVVFQISPIFGDADKSMRSDELHKIDEFSSCGNQLYFSQDSVASLTSVLYETDVSE